MNPRMKGSRRLPALGRALACAQLVVAMACACASGGGRPAATASTPGAPPPALPGASPSASPPVASPPPASAQLRIDAVQRLGPGIGFLSGVTAGGPLLAVTADGGATWRRVAAPATMTALRFVSERVGWAAASADPDARTGLVLRTTDGGATWQQTLSFVVGGPGGEPVRQLEAADADHAWVLTGAAPPCASPCPTELRRTTDGGRTWTTLVRGVDAVRFASASRGWLAVSDFAGGTRARLTNDGGTTWEDAFQTRSGSVVGLDAATTGTAWLLTRDLRSCTASSCLRFELFRTDDGRRWSSLGNPKDHAGSCVVGHLLGPLFASPTRGWLALTLGAGGARGGQGGLMGTGDGGRTWRCVDMPHTLRVSGADPP